MNESKTAPPADTLDEQYGRRVEADRSWTVYHVFTGVPARFGGGSMVGLTRSAATSGMLSLNSRNVERRRERAEPRPFTHGPVLTSACRA